MNRKVLNTGITGERQWNIVCRLNGDKRILPSAEPVEIWSHPCELASTRGEVGLGLKAMTVF
jgi:hypothetical protein